MGPRRFLLSLLRVPLAWKIAGANALLTAALAAGFYLLPAALSGPLTRSALLIGVVLTAAAVNLVLIALALDPIHELERTAQELWSGATEVRVRRSPLFDRELSRVARALNDLLEELAADRKRLRQLTAKLIESRSLERAVIARELTESVAQSATALALQCAALKNGNGDAPRAERLDRMQQVAASLVDEIRRIARHVHPRHLEELGLDVALNSLSHEAAAAGPQRVTYITRGIPATADALPHAVAAVLYEVAREALQNARRYSQGSRVDVSLGVERHVVRLSIVDDGCGFTAGTIDPDKGLGLGLMRERVALVGGSLEILSGPGKGTRIVASIPLEAPRSAAPPELASTFQEERHSW